MGLLSWQNLIRYTIINFLLFFGVIYYLNYQENNRENNQVLAVQETVTPTPVIATSETVNPTSMIIPTKAVVKVENISEKVAKHSQQADCWIIYKGNPYNITAYFGSHPAGDAIMAKYCGKDATAAFDATPHSSTAIGLLAKYLVK